MADARTPSPVQIYDTTLRDGSQLEGISLTVDDKLRIAEQLDWLGVHYIEAGWPGANPKDDELFRRTPSELQLSTSTLVAFGSTRRVKGKVDSDDTLRGFLDTYWSGLGKLSVLAERQLSFEPVLETAIALGAPTIRVWAGGLGSAEASPEYFDAAADELTDISHQAGKEGWPSLYHDECLFWPLTH